MYLYLHLAFNAKGMHVPGMCAHATHVFPGLQSGARIASRGGEAQSPCVPAWRLAPCTGVAGDRQGLTSPSKPLDHRPLLCGS